VGDAALGGVAGIDTDFEEASRTSLSPPVDIRSAMPGLRHEGNWHARLLGQSMGEKLNRFAGVAQERRAMSRGSESSVRLVLRESKLGNQRVQVAVFGRLPKVR
jgi:hypothetical protein